MRKYLIKFPPQTVVLLPSPFVCVSAFFFLFFLFFLLFVLLVEFTLTILGLTRSSFLFALGLARVSTKNDVALETLLNPARLLVSTLGTNTSARIIAGVETVCIVFTARHRDYTEQKGRVHKSQK